MIFHTKLHVKWWSYFLPLFLKFVEVKLVRGRTSMFGKNVKHKAVKTLCVLTNLRDNCWNVIKRLYILRVKNSSSRTARNLDKTRNVQNLRRDLWNFTNKFLFIFFFFFFFFFVAFLHYAAKPCFFISR